MLFRSVIDNCASIVCISCVTLASCGDSDSIGLKSNVIWFVFFVRINKLIKAEMVANYGSYGIQCALKRFMRVN